MADISAEDLAQRILDANLLDPEQLEAAWSELGSRGVSADALARVLVRRELLTSFQVDRLLAGERHGFYWGRYKVLYFVGAGTFARVYRAVHRETGQVAALKVLRQRFCDDPAAKEEFVHEAQLVMKLRHPNIVPVYEVGDERGRTYMVMEFVEGNDLRKLLRVRKKFGVEEALKLIADVCAGLDYALRHGVPHRDLKLSNVLVSAQGVAKLVDFGLAALADLKESGGGRAARSIDYAGLERATRAPRNDPRSDIYFAGCMLYQLLTGAPPLSETRERSKRLDVSRFREVRPITDVDPDLPRCAAHVVSRAMELDPNRRFATPGEMLSEVKAALQRLASGEPDEAPAPAAAAPAPDQDADAPSHTVLVVEANVEMQNALRDGLKKLGYRALVIRDPRRAIERLTDETGPSVDCVIFSAMELGDGAVDALNQMAAHEATRSIPAILLLEEHQRDLAARAALAEHRLAAALPLRLRQLLAAVKKLVETYGAVSEESP